MTPAVLSDKPVGKDPELIDHVNVVAVPAAWSVKEYADPKAGAGSVAVVIAGFVAIVSVNGALAVARLPSVTCIVKLAAPAAVGLPLI
jgi:hypothetical protein